MLIRLTGVPHPDMHGGVAQPVYLDPKMVMMVCQGWQQYPKIGSVERKQELARKLYDAACNLSDHVGGYLPRMDDPVAVGWMHTARSTANEVQNAYQKWSYGSRDSDFHPRVDCTEIQLSCGTALEHGVMLARVWVSEEPEEVAARVMDAT